MGADRRLRRPRQDDGRRRRRAADGWSDAPSDLLELTADGFTGAPVHNDRRMMSSTAAATLLDRIRARRATVGVIGLGYVGLPLAVELARSGFVAAGFDVGAPKSAEINAGRSYIPDVPTDDVATVVRDGTLKATADM